MVTHGSHCFVTKYFKNEKSGPVVDKDATDRMRVQSVLRSRQSMKKTWKSRQIWISHAGIETKNPESKRTNNVQALISTIINMISKFSLDWNRQ